MQNYGGYYQPSQTPYVQQPYNYNLPQNQPQQVGITWVQGEAGAKSYLVAPNTTAILWDSETPVIYVKSADVNGMPSMRIIDYKYRDMEPTTSHQTSPDIYVTKDEFASLKEKVQILEDRLGGRKDE